MRTLPPWLPALALAAALAAACGDEKAAEDPIRPVIAMQVRSGAAEGRDVYAGEVRARYETDVGFRVGGKLVARSVDAGATVRRGQVLARLDPADARLAASGARAQVAAAESDFATARSELARHEELLARRFISASAFEAKQNAYSAAKSRLEQARSLAEISVNQAGYTTLVADADGVVVSVAAEPGQVVAAGQPVVRLARAGEKEVVVNAPESQLARFQVGREVAISLWADPARLIAGRIREVAGGADPVTRTYLVRVSAIDAPADVRIGMSANVHFKAVESADLVVVPLTAITRSGSDAAVWVVDPATKQVRLRPVSVAQFREDGASVRGLAAGEWVVTAGVQKLRPDQVVRLMQRDGAVFTATN